MSRTRSRVVFLLLILILLVVSTLLSLLPEWLSRQTPPQGRGAGGKLWPADNPAASDSPIVTVIERWTG